MYTPSLKTAASTMFKLYSLYHLVSLRAADVARESPELLSRYEAAHETLGGLLRAREDAEFRLVEAGARRDRAHRLMERGLRDFAYAALGVVQEDRSSPRYRMFFPNGYGYVCRSRTETLIAEAARILTLLRQVPDERFADAGEALAGVLAQVSTVQSDYEAACDALEAATRAVENGKRPWRDAYRSSYHRLSILHVDDPRRADDYFRRLDRRRSAEAETEVEVEVEVDPEEGAVAEGDIASVTDGESADDAQSTRIAESGVVAESELEEAAAESAAEPAAEPHAPPAAEPATLHVVRAGLSPAFESEDFARLRNA
ncbi:MAG: hypothetical protein R3E97_23805 [Candidatus Eisenbacteria bacterium]